MAGRWNMTTQPSVSHPGPAPYQEHRPKQSQHSHCLPTSTWAEPSTACVCTALETKAPQDASGNFYCTRHTCQLGFHAPSCCSLETQPCLLHCSCTHAAAAYDELRKRHSLSPDGQGWHGSMHGPSKNPTAQSERILAQLLSVKSHEATRNRT